MILPCLFVLFLDQTSYQILTFHLNKKLIFCLIILSFNCNSHTGLTYFLEKTTVIVFLQFNVMPLSSFSTTLLSSIFGNFALLLSIKTMSPASLMFLIIIPPTLMPSSFPSSLEIILPYRENKFSDQNTFLPDITYYCLPFTCLISNSHCSRLVII